MRRRMQAREGLGHPSLALSHVKDSKYCQVSPWESHWLHTGRMMQHICFVSTLMIPVGLKAGSPLITEYLKYTWTPSSDSTINCKSEKHHRKFFNFFPQAKWFYVEICKTTNFATPQLTLHSIFLPFFSFLFLFSYYGGGVVRKGRVKCTGSLIRA